MFGSQQNTVGPSEFAQLFLSGRSNNTIPPCPPCVCQCPVHSQPQYFPAQSPYYYHGGVHPPSIQTYSPSVYAPPIYVNTESGLNPYATQIDHNDENYEHQPSNGPLPVDLEYSEDSEEQEPSEDSEESLHLEIETQNEPQAELRWAEEDEMLIHLDYDTFADYVKSYPCERSFLDSSGTGITYGVLIGSQVDDINIKVQQIRQLYSYSPDDNLQQFTEQAVARIYELLQDPTNSGEFIGWYQANVGLSCAIPNIVTETFKSVQESFMGDTACKSALFMVIDIQKSKHDISFPCMECYDLRKACKPDTNPVGSALAFSFN